jgi:putative membrane protein
MQQITRKEARLLAATVVGFMALTLIRPADPLTWLLEAFPVLIGLPLLYLSRKTFPLTPMAYRLLCLHALILLLGAHYTYAEVPIGYWAQDLFGFSRNHYDRIGHLAQGFIPAIIAREVLLRRTRLEDNGWLFFLTVCVCLAISATYEFIEWGAALLLNQSADAFLGTQGDPWDTQWDMFLAFIGSISSQLALRTTHKRQLSGQ